MMEWHYTPGSNRASYIKMLTETIRPPESKYHAECVRHCYRGNTWSGVLWSVWQRSEQIEPGVFQWRERWIKCDLMKYDRQDEGWGHKPMEESCGPYYYSCPLGYLALVPDDGINTVNHGWREGVRAWHEQALNRRRSKRKAVTSCSAR